eukprot:1004324-Pelagomonas_calceolata.AAC.1
MTYIRASKQCNKMSEAGRAGDNGRSQGRSAAPQGKWTRLANSVYSCCKFQQYCRENVGHTVMDKYHTSILPFDSRIIYMCMCLAEERCAKLPCPKTWQQAFLSRLQPGVTYTCAHALTHIAEHFHLLADC